MTILSFEQGGAVKFRTSLTPKTSSIWMRTRAATVVYFAPFISRITAYANEVSAFLSYARSTAEKALESVTSPPTLRVDAKLHGPHVILPDKARIGQIIWNVGTCIIKDSGDDEVETAKGTITATLKDSVLLSEFFGAATTKAVIEHMDFIVVLERFPSFNLTARIPSIKINCTKNEYALLLDVFAAMSTKKETSEPSVSNNAVSQKKRVSSDTNWKCYFSLDLVALTLDGISSGFIHGFSVEAVSVVDDMQATVILQSISMEDAIPNSTSKFRKMIEMTEDSQTPLAHISYRQQQVKAVTQYTIAANLCRPRFYVIPAMLMGITGFFSVEKTSTENVIPKKENYAKPLRSSAVSAASAISVKSQFAMDVKLCVRDTEFVAIEDTTVSDSSSVVLRLKQFSLQASLAGSQGNVMIALEDLELFSCTFSQRSSTQVSILSPIQINLTVTKNQERIRVSFDTTNFDSTVAYHDLRLALLVALQFTRLSDSTIGQVPSAAPTLTFVDHSAYAIQEVQTETSHLDISPPAPPLSSVLKDFRLESSLAIPRIKLTLINDRNGQITPLFELLLASIGFESLSNLTENSLRFTFECQYYNEFISMWEPLIEPFKCGLALSYCPHPLVSVSPLDTIDITISSAFLTSFFAVYSSWASDYKAYIHNIGINTRMSFKPYRVFNNTGRRLLFFMGSHSTALEPGEIADLELCRSEGMGQVVVMKFQVEQCLPTPWIPVNRVQVLAFPVDPGAVPSKRVLIVDITLVSGVKNISLRSPFRLVNSSAMPIDIIFKGEDNASVTYSGVPAGQCTYFPIMLADSCGCSVRPSEFGFNWSKPFIWSSLRTNKSITISSEHPDCKVGVHPVMFNGLLQRENKVKQSVTVLSTIPTEKFLVSICAPFQIRNLLPYSFEYRLADTYTRQCTSDVIKSGETAQIHTVGKIHNYFYT